MTLSRPMIYQLSEPIAYSSPHSQTSLQPHWPQRSLNNPRMLTPRASAVSLSDLHALLLQEPPGSSSFLQASV